MRLLKRVVALEGGPTPCKPLCWVIPELGYTPEQSLARHLAAGECIPDSGGHVVWTIVDGGRDAAA